MTTHPDNSPNKPLVSFVTLGCAKNEVDSNRMRSLIDACPFLMFTPDASEADVVIVNTCSFLVSAVEEGIETTLDIVNGQIEGGRAPKVIMSGCIPSRYGAQIDEEMDEVSAFLAVEDEDRIVQTVCEVLGIDAADYDRPTVMRTVEAPYAYVKISDGCDRFCSFCAIPYIRGRYYSRPAETILAEIDHLVENGVREIVLIGQDTGIWGSDLDGTPTLAWLLRRAADAVASVDGIVRVLYLQPEGMTDELIEVIRDHPNIAKYIDIPLQHCDADVLRRMNRSGGKQEFLDLVDRLRREIPGVTLRTTAMVGFPGETDEQFEELVDFLEEAQFDYHAVFAYSQEEGTEASELDGQVPEDVKVEREQRVIDTVEPIGFASAANHIGEVARVLVDGIEDNGDGTFDIIGRAAFQAPDSDGVVHIADGDVTVGSFVDVRIDDAACYELFGSIV